MTDVAKKVVTLLVIAFAAFYLLTQPESAAGAIKTALDAVVDGLRSGCPLLHRARRLRTSVRGGMVAAKLR
ncbi:MAG: hypothetical protein WKF73_21595 [Nocardioidaceae bacterium]